MARRPAALAAAFAALSAVAAPAVLPAAASAGRPGVWTAVTSADGANIDQVGLARTPDGRLHVAWQRKTPGHDVDDDLMQTVVEPDGAVGAAQTIASDWIGIGSPSLARAADGSLLLVAGATSTLDPGAISSIGAWRSTDGGASWSAPVRATRDGGFADDLGLAFGSDGATPFIAWGSTFGLFVNRGVDPAVVPGNFQSANGFGCCGYSPGLARDEASGQLVVAWHSNATGHLGVFAQEVDQATGNPVGGAKLMPGSVSTYAGRKDTSYSLAHTPIVSRPGRAGLYLAYEGGYPTTRRVVVWRYGATRSTIVATREQGVRTVGIAATPEGRLWAFWSGGGRIWARRSNRAATAWGAITSTPVRRGTDTVYKLAGNAQSGLLDVFGAFAGTAPGVQTWHTQLRAGLSLTAAPARATAGARRAQPITFGVTDAGEPVAGAKVTLGGASATTGARGTVTLAIPAGARRGPRTARATRAGYVDATAVVRVR
jgi:hypothetical protein